MLQEVQTPFVRTTSKARYGVCDEARAIVESLKMAAGVPRPVPVIFGGRILGFAFGRDWLSTEVGFYPIPLQCGFNDYSQIIEALTHGQRFGTIWAKSPTTSAVVNNWYDLWGVVGNPSSGNYSGTSLTSRQFDETTTGSIWHGGDVSPATDHILSAWAVTSATTPNLMLTDRVLSYDACPFAANVQQVCINSLPAQRYASNTDPGLILSLVADSAQNGTAVDFTQLTYVNNVGTAGQAMPTSPTVSSIASADAPTANLGARCFTPATAGTTVTWSYAMPMATGDTGMQSVTSYTPSAARTGTFSMILHYPLAYLPIAAANIVSEKDYVMNTPGLPRIVDGACLQWWHLTSTTSGFNINGAIETAWR